MRNRANRPISSHKLTFADFTIDLEAGELHKNGSRVRLQDQPFQLLALLTQRTGEVVTREELRQHLWPADTFVDFDNSLNAAVAKIREALTDSPDCPRFIETLPRRGYRFIANVKPVNGAALQSPPPTTIVPVAVQTYAAALGGFLLLWHWQAWRSLCFPLHSVARGCRKLFATFSSLTMANRRRGPCPSSTF